jgi:pantoate kinase
MDAEAFVPGHITGFFEIHLDSSDPLKCGSRGAGFCIDKGARTKVTIDASNKLNVKVILNGSELHTGSSTTHSVVRAMLGTEPYDVIVETKTGVPVSQGLGMSGAGALGTAMALDAALDLGIGPEALVAHAHSAEIENRSGLGDIIAQSQGGLEVRTAPGAPPFGAIETSAWDEHILLVVLEPPLSTEQIITSAEHQAKLNSLCSELLERLGAPPEPKLFLRLAQDFTLNSGIASEKLLKALESVPEDYGAGMAMLGNTLYITGEEAHGLAPDFERFGKCILAEIDNRGAHKL